MPDPELDENGNPKPAAAPPPALDAAALGKQVSDAAQAAVREALANQPPAQPYQPPVAQPTDALEDVLAPYINKSANKAVLIAQMAADKADFYAVDDPEVMAERLHFKEEVEKRALALAQMGRALPREDVFKHLKGEQEEKVQEFRGARRKAREDRVRMEGQDHGGGSMPRDGGIPRLVSADQAYDLQASGKLEEALSDKSF